MKRIDEIKGKDKISVFGVRKEVSNEEVLQMIYNDFSSKLKFIQTVYPYYCGLYMYDVVYKIFGQPFDYINGKNTKIEYFSDTFEECNKAFEEGVFGVERSLFSRGEWPIILFERISEPDRKMDWISYVITR